MTYNAIMIGTGGVGSAALYHAARRGARVLGIDRFPGGHDRGSSHGQTRIIRQAYFEHSDYVPLLLRAYELWHELEMRCERQLFFPVGLVEIGPPDGVVIHGVMESARRHSLDVDRLSRDEAARRFPGFAIPDDCVAAFESKAGYLLVEDCVCAHLQEAAQLGAELVVGESVLGWHRSGNHVVVQTDRNRYEAERLIVAAGAWAGKVLASCNLELRAVRKHLHWYTAADAQYRADQGCPTFFYETPDGYFYGFPEIDNNGVKVAEHSGGIEVTDPRHDLRDVDPQDRTRVEQFLKTHLPGVTTSPTRHEVCYYTMSPDEHFIVDHHPENPAIVFAAGLSGHGFKFTSVLGEVLVDLAFGGQTKQPIDFLRLTRFRKHSNPP